MDDEKYVWWTPSGYVVKERPFYGDFTAQNYGCREWAYVTVWRAKPDDDGPQFYEVIRWYGEDRPIGGCCVALDHWEEFSCMELPGFVAWAASASLAMVQLHKLGFKQDD